MMKRLFLILIVFILFGCQKEFNYEDLGYTNKESNIIFTFDNIVQESFNPYDNKKAILINNEGFISKNISAYLSIIDDYEIDECIYIVNNGLLDDIDKYEKVKKDKCYLEENTLDYIKFFNEYDSVRETVEAVNTKAIYPQYIFDEETDITKGYQILVNKHYHLNEDYVPKELEKVDLKYTKYELLLEKTCYEAYKRMYDDALKENLDLNIDSAYRSYQLQELSYSNFLTIDSQMVVDTYSARPGHSEHQTGLAIDIIPKGYTYDDVQFSNEVRWLNENCYKYGFIIRYQEGKESITGYKAEPWQVRYVGDIAEDVMKSGLTYDEYYEVYLK